MVDGESLFGFLLLFIPFFFLAWHQWRYVLKHDLRKKENRKEWVSWLGVIAFFGLAGVFFFVFVFIIIIASFSGMGVTWEDIQFLLEMFIMECVISILGVGYYYNGGEFGY